MMWAFIDYQAVAKSAMRVEVVTHLEAVRQFVMELSLLTHRLPPRFDREIVATGVKALSFSKRVTPPTNIFAFTVDSK